MVLMVSHWNGSKTTLVTDPSMYAAVGQNRILLTLQWVSHKDLFLDHCCFLYTQETLKE